MQVIVKDGGNVFGGELPRRVANEQAGFANRTISGAQEDLELICLHLNK